MELHNVCVAMNVIVKRRKKMAKKFPDMSGDGKVTKKDILIARGVIKKKGAKNGKVMSKRKSGSKKKV